ncbi:uncharacterized protein C8A04DRAFT_33757 [Dichotomopilus funicola]|uniref:Serum paraoxonase/arylesterase family protein n=1 Tax=Dichotomopilus funicola TaxID=1934379 RepID=A0AAN6ZTE0_9PEZI|nr:hypothetical protein C8A04DRAFT_33757 [Dichotomopilus funicola]
MRLFLLSLMGAFLAYGLYTVARPIYQTVIVFGFLRKYPNGATTDTEVIAIPDTVHCEDLHYHASSGTVFAACEDDPDTRFKWFPPIANFDDPELASRSRGSIHVVDPKTMKSERLKFQNFAGPFITHGIDVIPDKDQPNGKAVYIFAINHVPETQPSGAKGPYARSQIELFHHIIGSSSVRHIRSIWHPLIKTPNDIFARSLSSIYVTNDHRHRLPGRERVIEDLYSGAKWTEVVHVRLNHRDTRGSASGVIAEEALSWMHNLNGLGHGRSEDEILISSCSSGVLHIGKLPEDGVGNITLVESVQVDHLADNPSYFADPYATNPDDDRSAFLETGLARAVDIVQTMRDPAGKDAARVTYLRPVSPGHWKKRVLFDDDGARLRSASGGVLVPIKPENTEEPRQAWLFATGFLSSSIIAVKVNL